MGPTWGREDLGGPHVCHMNLAIWDGTEEIGLVTPTLGIVRVNIMYEQLCYHMMCKWTRFKNLTFYLTMYVLSALAGYKGQKWPRRIVHFHAAINLSQGRYPLGELVEPDLPNHRKNFFYRNKLINRKVNPLLWSIYVKNAYLYSFSFLDIDTKQMIEILTLVKLLNRIHIHRKIIILHDIVKTVILLTMALSRWQYTNSGLFHGLGAYRRKDIKWTMKYYDKIWCGSYYIDTRFMGEH